MKNGLLLSTLILVLSNACFAKNTDLTVQTSDLNNPFDRSNWYPATPLSAFLLFGTACFYRLVTKEGVKNFEYKGDFQELINYKLSPKEYMKNIWNLFDSYVIGQKEERKSTIKIENEGTVRLKTDLDNKPCAGFCGHAHAQALAINESCKAFYPILALYVAINSGKADSLLNKGK